MSKINIHKNNSAILIKPDLYDFEVVERKFRGHPDSLADMVAQRFSQLYIDKAWKLFPELKNKAFPNFSADKITLSGASTKYSNKSYEVIKPINALLIGKITKNIGDVSLDIDSIFKEAVTDIMCKALGTKDFIPYVVYDIFISTSAGTDHNPSFYNPNSTSELLKIMSEETYANDTVYVVAYSPLSITENLVIWLDNITASNKFKRIFPEIGSDIKVMVRRRTNTFDITLCLPILPEKVGSIQMYDLIIKNTTDYLKSEIKSFLKNDRNVEKPVINLWVNTKDTVNKKYFAIWGTALSKGDIGAVGRGNRQQGFISGMRPSTNEAVSGKNPNHFAGIIYQLIAEDITKTIYSETKIPNAVYITANNGDHLNNPNSIDIIIDGSLKLSDRNIIDKIIQNSLNNVDRHRMDFINGDVYQRFMK